MKLIHNYVTFIWNMYISFFILKFFLPPISNAIRFLLKAFLFLFGNNKYHNFMKALLFGKQWNSRHKYIHLGCFFFREGILSITHSIFPVLLILFQVVPHYLPSSNTSYPFADFQQFVSILFDNLMLTFLWKDVTTELYKEHGFFNVQYFMTLTVQYCVFFIQWTISLRKLLSVSISYILNLISTLLLKFVSSVKGDKHLGYADRVSCYIPGRAGVTYMSYRNMVSVTVLPFPYEGHLL